MWGAYELLAAETIDGINSVLWTYNYGNGDEYWLTEHDSSWGYRDTGDAGWAGDPRVGEEPDQQFYKTEVNFNLDLNNDGDIGFDNKNHSRYQEIQPIQLNRVKISISMSGIC